MPSSAWAAVNGSAATAANATIFDRRIIQFSPRMNAGKSHEKGAGASRPPLIQRLGSGRSLHRLEALVHLHPLFRRDAPVMVRIGQIEVVERGVGHFLERHAVVVIG